MGAVNQLQLGGTTLYLEPSRDPTQIIQFIKHWVQCFTPCFAVFFCGAFDVFCGKTRMAIEPRQMARSLQKLALVDPLSTKKKLVALNPRLIIEGKHTYIYIYILIIIYIYILIIIYIHIHIWKFHYNTFSLTTSAELAWAQLAHNGRKPNDLDRT